ncbi:hypothetical protein VNO77_20637 [Canavalia gladiata]|uniref:Uncharacterized protein n=1 Tax=Canavalia gladiata TaxID=3824 RepID=A0AAN9QQR8_CANGL
MYKITRTLTFINLVQDVKVKGKISSYRWLGCSYHQANRVKTSSSRIMIRSGASIRLASTLNMHDQDKTRPLGEMIDSIAGYKQSLRATSRIPLGRCSYWTKKNLGSR